MSGNILYSDKLLEIDDYSILLQDYYFPSSRSRRINFAEIDSVTVVKPTISTGQYRTWGWDGRRWFAQDSDRSERELIFWMELQDNEDLNRFLPSSTLSIGFTAENAQQVSRLLKEKCRVVDLLYADNLVEINDDSIFFWGYYFGLRPKRVKLNDIVNVTVHEAGAGKRPCFGTRDFRTWFPPDLARPAREKIFVMKLRKKWWQIGFSVEDPEAVTAILEKNLHLPLQYSPSP